MEKLSNNKSIEQINESFVSKDLDNYDTAADLAYELPSFKGEILEKALDIILDSNENYNETSSCLLKTICDGYIEEDINLKKALTFMIKKGNREDIKKILHASENLDAKEYPLYKKLAFFIEEIKIENNLKTL